MGGHFSTGCRMLYEYKHENEMEKERVFYELKESPKRSCISML